MSECKVYFDKKSKAFVLEFPILKDGLVDIVVKKVSVGDVIKFVRRYRFVNYNKKYDYIVPRRELLKEIAWRELRRDDVDSVELLANAFQGGTYRNLYYFPKYYYPLKVLVAKKVLKVQNAHLVSSEGKIKEALVYLNKLKRGE